MTVTKDNAADNDPGSTPSSSLPRAETPNAGAFISKGYRVHNEITYRGIDWLLNSTVGVASTYWVEKSDWGNKHIGRPVTQFFDRILKPLIKDDIARMEGAAWAKRFANIMVGGFTIIPIMMVMENKKIKKATVRWMDEKLYGKDTIANDQKFQTSYDRIDDEPRKGFWTGIVARFIAIAPLITLAVIEKTNRPLTKYIYDPIGKVTQTVAEKIGIKPIKTLEKEAKLFDKETNSWITKPILPDGTIKIPKNGGAPAPTDQLSKWDFLHRIIGFDFGLTIFYAILHEIAYKSLAAMGMKNGKSSHAESAATALTSAPPVTSVGSAPAADPVMAQTASWQDKTATREKPEKAENYLHAVDKSRAVLGDQPAVG